MLSTRLAAPLLNAAEINERLDVVEFFYKHHDLRQSMREVLRRCADIERSVARLGVGRGGPRDLKAVAQTLAVLPKIKVMLETYKRIEVADEAPKALQNIVKRLGNHDNLVDVLFRALRSEEDSQLPLLARDGGCIQRGYSAEFDAVCDMRDKGARYMDELEAKYAAQTQIDHLKVKYNNVIGYYVEVPAKWATKLLDNPEFIHRQSMLNSTRFVTVELTELENEIRGASEKALAIELGLYNDLVMHIIISADGILKSAAALAELDVATALADLALERGYCRPVVDESLAFEVLDGRHPMVEAALKRDHNGDFVGNDCVLNV
jgi:DNA mismatch repair protein MutS